MYRRHRKRHLNVSYAQAETIVAVSEGFRTQRGLSDHLGISHTSARNRIEILLDKGFLIYEPNQSSTLRVVPGIKVISYLENGMSKLGLWQQIE